MIEKFIGLINWVVSHQLPVSEQFVALHHLTGAFMAIVILIIGAMCAMFAVSGDTDGCVVLWVLPIALILAPIMYIVGSWIIPIVVVWTVGAWTYKIYHRRNWLPY